MKCPNSIKIYYPDKVNMILIFKSTCDLIEGIKKEALNLSKRQHSKAPLPLKMIITIGRRKDDKMAKEKNT